MCTQTPRTGQDRLGRGLGSPSRAGDQECPALATSGSSARCRDGHGRGTKATERPRVPYRSLVFAALLSSWMFLTICTRYFEKEIIVFTQKKIPSEMNGGKEEGLCLLLCTHTWTRVCTIPEFSLPRCQARVGRREPAGRGEAMRGPSPLLPEEHSPTAQSPPLLALAGLVTRPWPQWVHQPDPGIP